MLGFAHMIEIWFFWLGLKIDLGQEMEPWVWFDYPPSIYNIPLLVESTTTKIIRKPAVGDNFISNFDSETG